MNLLSLEWWSAAHDLLITTVIWVLCLVWLYQGGHALATRSSVRFVTVRTLASGAICIALGAMNYWIHINMEHLAAMTNQVSRDIKQLPPDWGMANSPSARERGSRIVASMGYVDLGKLFKYVDSDGIWKDYCPTTEDASHIRERTTLIVRASEISNQSHTSAIRTWTAGAIALILGFSIGHIGRHKGANPSINTDSAQ